jgi:hypothetical protein
MTGREEPKRAQMVVFIRNLRCQGICKNLQTKDWGIEPIPLRDLARASQQLNPRFEVGTDGEIAAVLRLRAIRRDAER